MEPLRWGVISTSKWAIDVVIPAMQKGELCRIDAIASRDESMARKAAEDLGIPRAYGSYEALLADPDIEAIYNPLPIHMHAEWTTRAAEAGKHVLCEKPLTMNAAEAEPLIAVRDRTGVLIVEAQKLRFHPQWRRVRDLVRQGRIGRLRTIQAEFAYMNTDPTDIRNRVEVGGGSLYDIGCYPIVIIRYLFGGEPLRAMALLERDPEMGIDRLSTTVLEFPGGHASFVCATQLVRSQHMRIVGTEGWIDIDIPFSPSATQACRLIVGGGTLGRDAAEEEVVPAADFFTLQGDAFARAVRTGTPPEFPLEDAVANMRVIDALFRSAASGRWENV